jgi:hypothetical protein
MDTLKILKYKEKIFPLIIGFLILVHIFILLQMLFFPYPELFIYSYLTDKGFMPYKQIIDQHFPGVMFLPVNLYSLGIDTLAEMRMVSFALIISGDLIFAKILKKLFNKNTYVFLGLLLYVFWQIYFEGHVLWIESFITPLLLGAFYLLMNFFDRKSYSQFYIAAFILGLSLVLKQTVLPLVGLIYLYLIYKKVPLKNIFYSLLLFSLPMCMVLLYFIKIGIIKDFFYWTVTFNLTAFAQMGKTHPTINDLIKTMPVFGTAAISILWLIRTRGLKKALLPGLFLLGSLFFAYARFDYIHLQPALPFAVILILFLLNNLKRNLLIASALVYFLVSLYIFIPSFRFNNRPGISPMLNDIDTVSLVNLVNKYKKGGSIFALGTYPHIYYLTNTLPPGGIFSFQFPWFMKVAENRVLEGILSDPPDIIVRDTTAQVDGLTLIDYMETIEDYVEKHYKVVDSVGSSEILVKI